MLNAFRILEKGRKILGKFIFLREFRIFKINRNGKYVPCKENGLNRVGELEQNKVYFGNKLICIEQRVLMGI